jgi:hypothetical protein
MTVSTLSAAKAQRAGLHHRAAERLSLLQRAPTLRLNFWYVFYANLQTKWLIRIHAFFFADACISCAWTIRNLKRDWVRTPSKAMHLTFCLTSGALFTDFRHDDQEGQEGQEG